MPGRHRLTLAPDNSKPKISVYPGTRFCIPGAFPLHHEDLFTNRWILAKQEPLYVRTNSLFTVIFFPLKVLLTLHFMCCLLFLHTAYHEDLSYQPLDIGQARTVIYPQQLIAYRDFFPRK
ncbi:hypothetical protein CEXT_621721 [Caerostris extrusa]|uniref:Uncharacterized protein n=1 Tax=Caerostris extrusa TaxID=172846 RepID=A0AAV4TEL2_CAEEX|nr:hypothetical protein CEXT_621721 [Caerostris extrusa]